MLVLVGVGDGRPGRTASAAGALDFGFLETKKLLRQSVDMIVKYILPGHHFFIEVLSV